MNAFVFSATYVKFGFACVLGLEHDDPKKSNHGECAYSWAAILGYTLSLFVIQLTMNSIMGHKYTRYA